MLPWLPNDAGAIAPFEGGDATHGYRGDWPPPDATVLTFSLADSAKGTTNHCDSSGTRAVGAAA
jgi:hypothetical protein